MNDDDIATIIRWLADHGFRVESYDRERGTATVRMHPPMEQPQR